MCFDMDIFEALIENNMFHELIWGSYFVQNNFTSILEQMPSPTLICNSSNFMQNTLKFDNNPA